MTLPKTVHITEVGPRDGLQNESRIVPTSIKSDLIAGLAAAGLPAVQVASFVHPKKVPQMADAEEVIQGLPKQSKCEFSALTLNVKGMERACGTDIPWIEVSLAATEEQSRQNAGMSIAEAQTQIRSMIAMALEARRRVRASIQCTFGCQQAGEVSIDQVKRLLDPLLSSGVHILVLADTTGMATPTAVRRMLEAILPLAGKTPLGLHLHDTRGLGLVNVMAALELGISHLDTSLGGLGGCPFVKGAAGNIATEETLQLLRSLDIATGVDVSPVAAWSRRLSEFFGRPLTGKLYKLI